MPEKRKRGKRQIDGETDRERFMVVTMLWLHGLFVRRSDVGDSPVASSRRRLLCSGRWGTAGTTVALSQHLKYVVLGFCILIVKWAKWAEHRIIGLKHSKWANL